MRTLIVLVNRNNKHDTIECLESLRRLEGDFDVFVSDNASTDGSIEAIRAWAQGAVAVDTASRAWDGIRNHPVLVEDVSWGVFDSEDRAIADRTPRWLTVASTGGSRGFPAGNNVGMRYGLTRDYDYFWILNNDTVTDPRALRTLIAKMESDPTIGICGSTLLFYARPDMVQVLGGCDYDHRTASSRPVGYGQRFPLDPASKAGLRPMAHVLGAAMFVPRRVLETVGLMNEDLYLYFEEIDWTMRLGARYRSGYEPASIVFHKHGGTMGGGVKRPSRHRIYYMTINRVLFTRRHYPGSLPTVVLALLAQAVKNALRGRWAISSWVLRDTLFALTKARYPLKEIP